MHMSETEMHTSLIEDPRGYSEIAIVLPTYCEGENIGSLIRDIQQFVKAKIVIVDDSSPDDTSEKVKELMSKYGNIKLIERPEKLGVGTAIKEGFRVLMSMEPQPDFIITMDADYSHNPEDIPRLVDVAKQGYDLVIGSRYCRGGKIIGAHPTRSLFSHLINIIVGVVFGIRVSDSTSGFRCYSRGFVKNILSQLSSQTYEIQVETLRQAKLRKFKFTETPITFIDRKRGQSKLSLGNSARLLSLLVFGRKDRVVEDNRIKLHIEGVTELMLTWKSIVDNLIAERKRRYAHA